MFSLVYGLWKHIFTKMEFHVLILGIDKAGKTVICLTITFEKSRMPMLFFFFFLVPNSCLSFFSNESQTLLEKLKSQYSNMEALPPDRIVPTVGLNIGRVEVSNTKLVFWDLGGQVLRFGMCSGLICLFMR